MTLPLCERQIAAARDRATIVDNIPHTGPKRPISVSRGKGPGEDPVATEILPPHGRTFARREKN